MASLKFSSRIEHVCLQEWNLSTQWLEGGFNTWTLTDTILFAMLALLCVYYHPRTKWILSSHIFSPHFHSFLLPYLFHSTLLLLTLLHPSFLHPPCPGIIPAVPSRDSFPYRHNEISQSSLPPSCTCTRERCIRNISTYTRAWGTTWGSTNKSSLQGL